MDRLALNKVFWIVVFIFDCFKPSAQESVTSFFLNDMPVNSLSDPAYQPESKGLSLGLPFFSGINLNYNSGFPLKYLLKKSSGIEGIGSNYDFGSFYNSLDTENKARISAAIPLLFVGLKSEKSYFSFSAVERGTITSRFSREIIGYLDKGNLPFWGKNEELGSGSLYTIYYRELGLGVSHRYNRKFTFGARIKLLMGKTFFNANQVNFSIETNMANNYLALFPEGSFTISAPLQINYVDSLNFTTIASNVSVGDYFLSIRNLGVSGDIGISYFAAERLRLKLGIVDFGYIGFKNKTYKFFFNRPVMYPQRYLYQSTDPSSKIFYKPPEIALSAFGDSLSYIVIPQIPGRRIIEPVPFRIFTGIDYEINSDVSVGMVHQYLHLNGYSLNSFTALFIASMINNLELALSATLNDLSQKSIGIAVNYAPDKFNIYLSTDNISGVLNPAGTKNLTLHFGLLLKFKS